MTTKTNKFNVHLSFLRHISDPMGVYMGNIYINGLTLTHSVVVQGVAM